MRRNLLTLLTAVLVLLAGSAIAWVIAEHQLRSGLANWIAARRAAGWSASSGQTSSGGWPLAATLTVPDVALSAPLRDLPGGLSWHVDRVVLKLTWLHPLALQLDAAGKQNIRLGSGPEIPYTAERLQAKTPFFRATRNGVFDLVGEMVKARIPLGGIQDVVAITHLSLQTKTMPQAQPDHPSLTAVLSANNIELPARVQSPLGKQIAMVDLDLALMGPLSDAPSITTRANEWRSAGGSLHVQRLQTSWGPLGLKAEANLKLDSDLQPTGTATAQVTGYAETLDALARGGVITRSGATAAKALLSLVATAPDNARPEQVDVPLSLQDRTLSMRQFPLLRLPELDWPRP